MSDMEDEMKKEIANLEIDQDKMFHLQAIVIEIDHYYSCCVMCCSKIDGILNKYKEFNGENERVIKLISALKEKTEIRFLNESFFLMGSIFLDRIAASVSAIWGNVRNVKTNSLSTIISSKKELIIALPCFDSDVFWAHLNKLNDELDEYRNKAIVHHVSLRKMKMVGIANDFSYTEISEGALFPRDHDQYLSHINIEQYVPILKDLYVTWWNIVKNGSGIMAAPAKK